MPKKTVKDVENGNVPEVAIPHLFNARMLGWEKAQFEAAKAIYDVEEANGKTLKAILKELVKLNKKKVK